MNDQQWGRRADAGRWIWSLPTCMIGAVIVAGLTVYLAATYRYHRVWTEPQRAYLAMYVSSTAATAIGLPPKRYELPAGAARYSNGDVMAFLRAAVYGGYRRQREERRRRGHPPGGGTV